MGYGSGISSRLVTISSLGILLLAVLAPRFSFWQVVLLLPFISIIFVFSIIAAFLTVTILQDNAKLSCLLDRRQKALRGLAFTTTSAWSAVLTRHSWEEGAKGAAGTRFDDILELIKASFVLPWYSRISPSRAFPMAVERVLRHIITDLSKRSETVDWPSVVVSRILPKVRDHLQHYRSIEHLSSTTSRSVSHPALPLPLPANAHPALSPQLHSTAAANSSSIGSHFRSMLERILNCVVSDNERSEVVQIAIREVVLGAIMLPTFDMMCESDFWNRQIDERGGRYLHEQKQVNKFLSALSTLPYPVASPATPRSSRTLPPASSISAHSSSRQFEAFLRSIPKLKSLGEARRLRADVERELRQARISVNQLPVTMEEGKEGDRKVKTATTYVERLEKARRGIDNRIVSLSGNAASSSSTATASNDPPISLYNVLTDPSSLAYWLEFMERRGRSRLVQFWLTVEGFKDPLEAAGQESALEDVEITIDSSNHTAAVASSTLAEDTVFLREMYFAGPSYSSLDIPAKHVETITSYIPGSGPLSQHQARQMKHAMYASQQAVYNQMEEEDWKAFTSSELYLKAAADIKRSLPITTTQDLSQTRDIPILPPTKRQLTAPARSANTEERTKPEVRSAIAAKHGTFAPTAATTLPTAVSVHPPVLARAATEMRSPQYGQPVNKDVVEISDPPLSPFSHTPKRAMPHLDVLMGGTTETARSPLFADEILGNHSGAAEDEDDFEQIQRMEAIQAALTSIIASDDLGVGLTEPLSPRPHGSLDSMSSSMVLPTRTREEETRRMSSKSAEDLRKIKASTASLSAPPSRVVSTAMYDPLIATQRSQAKDAAGYKAPRKLFDEDNDEDHHGYNGKDKLYSPEETPDMVHLAGSGNLLLHKEIARLQGTIEQLATQDHLLDSLVRQADLTGNEAELRILMRSQSSVRREQRQAIFKKASFEQQEEINRLSPGLTIVRIPVATLSMEEGEIGKQVVRYTIEISKLSQESSVIAAWSLTRRYNDFYDLDKALKDWIASNGDVKLQDDLKHKLVELPGKKLVTNMSAGFVEARRLGLERYLQALTSSQPICDSEVLRAFLSRKSSRQSSVSPVGNGSTASPTVLTPQNIVKTIYKTMADSLDDAGLGTSMLDIMSQTLNRQMSELAEGFGGIVGASSDDLASMSTNLLQSALQAAASASSNDGVSNGALNKPGSGIHPLGGESGLGSFTAPICDLFIEIFDLQENNWLRRQAIVILLQQVLGGTVERKVRDLSRNLLSAESFDRYLGVFQQTLWPDGIRRSPSALRTETEKAETMSNASKKLGQLIPDVAANMIGRGNARRAARRVFGVVQDQRLNQQLWLCIIDEIVQALFPP